MFKSAPLSVNILIKLEHGILYPSNLLATPSFMLQDFIGCTKLLNAAAEIIKCFISRVINYRLINCKLETRLTGP